MRILVTGGAGFIGKYLVSSLLKNNTVTIYDNLESSSKDSIAPLIKLGVYFVKGNILDMKLLRESSKEVDVIIHLAAKSDVIKSTSYPEITNKTNVEGTENVLSCCVENNIKKIIFASSAAVYGNSKVPITEKTTTNPISPYGKSKLSAENIIKKTCEENNVGYIIFRMFNVYGRGQNKNYSGVITKFLKNIAHDEPLMIYGDGKQTRDFISINDVVKAFECALKSEKNGTYNIASGKSLSINELVEIFQSFSDKKLKIIYEEKQEGDIESSHANITLAKKKIDFNPEKSLKDELANIYHG